MSRIAVIGAGAWGTSLSVVLGRKGSHTVRLWAFEETVCRSVAERRVNELFLPGQTIPESVSVTGCIKEALCDAELVVSAMPSQHCRRLFKEMQPDLRSGVPIVSATKGLEEHTLLRMTEVIQEVIGPSRIAALSGPTFAKEVARGDPTAIALGCSDRALAQNIQHEFSDSGFRVYTNDDVIGVELGGALKNVIAIAAGICDGLGLGHNSIAALITRGLAEMTRLVVARGGKAETMAGLSGLGDLVLTCTGGLSRNRSVGVELGRGRKLAEILAGMHGSVAEGVFTTGATIGLAKAGSLEMPIAAQVFAILHEGKSPRDAIRDLMSREFKRER